MLDVGGNSAQLAVSQALGTGGLHKVGARNAAQMDKAASDFEAMFMSQMVQPMFDTVAIDDQFGGGHGEEIMRGMMTQQFGKAIAAGGHTGLTAEIKADMIRLQNVQAAAANAYNQAAQTANFNPAMENAL